VVDLWSTSGVLATVKVAVTTRVVSQRRHVHGTVLPAARTTMVTAVVVIIVIDDDCGDALQSPARQALADREEAALSAPTAVANSGASAIVVVDDDSHPAMDAAGEMLSAVVDDWPEHGRVGSHLQTAADLMRTFPVAGTGPTARNSSGMAPARKPLALTYSPQPWSSGPLAAAVLILVDDRETARSGARRPSCASTLGWPTGSSRVACRRAMPCSLRG